VLGAANRPSTPVPDREPRLLIEKVPLSIPGGIILLLRRHSTLWAVTRDDLERVRADAQREAAGAH